MSLNWRIHTGSALSVLQSLPDESVQCCVTSPPYFGLRDYGEDGQIGLEESPAEYVRVLVEVFQEVRRVLKSDGVCFLNLGDSYHRSQITNVPQTKTGGPDEYPQHIKKRVAVSRGVVPSQSPDDRCALACDSDGRGLQDSPATGSSCPDLCDGCSVALLTGIGCSGQPLELSASPHALTTRDSETRGCAEASPAASPHAAQASTTIESCGPLSAACSHCANCGACLSVLRSFSRDGQLCARKVGSTVGSGQPGSDGRNQRMDVLGTAWLNYNLKPKDLIGIPWMVAFALRADGWYLRSDIVWSKANPMPESVQDRPTKSHEYVFLLSKSPRYYYNPDAIREPFSESMMAQLENPYANTSRKDYAGAGVQDPSETKARIIANQRSKVQLVKGENADRNDGGAQDIAPRGFGANCRSVWRINTKPYPEAHFATFPEELPTKCLLAGSRPGDVILDPFCGSGTTGAAAIGNGRSFVGIELNSQYVELARKRIGSVAPLLAQEVA